MTGAASVLERGEVCFSAAATTFRACPSAGNSSDGNRLPQSLLLHSSLQLNPRLLLALQGSWVNWRDAFITLPVALTNGTNRDLNGLLSSMQRAIQGQ